MEKSGTHGNSINLLLRRVDWRFLLSDPFPKKSICFAGNELKAAVEEISLNVVDQASKDDDCELAVALNPDQETLKEAWSALKPGGALYVEWNPGLFANPNTIKQKLEASGFDRIALYLPRINPQTGLFHIWLPIENKKAIEFFIDQTLTNKSKNLSKSAATLLRSYLWRLRPNIFLTYPWLLNPPLKKYTLCSIACKTSTKPSNNKVTMESIEYSGSSELKGVEHNTIQAKLKSWGIDENSNKFSFLMLTEGTSIYKKAILFVFNKIRNEPSFVIKFSRIPESASQLSMEAETLHTIQEKFGDINGVPKLLFHDQRPDFSMAAETFIRGTSINKVLTKNNYRELALKSTELLVELGTKTKENAADDSWDRLVKPILSEFLSSFGSVLNPGLIQQTIDIINKFELTHVVCEHTDFSPWNILIDSNGNIGVLDWEGSLLQGLPVVDLVYFMTYLSADLEESPEPAVFLESYRKMLDQSTFTGKIFKDCLDYYTSSVGISVSSIPALRLLTWLDVLNWKYNELAIDEDLPPDRDSLKNILQICLWEEELRMNGVSED